MVLKVTVPNLKSLIPWIESLLPNRYGARRVRLERYVSVETVMSLTNLTSAAILVKLRNNRRLHGLLLKGELLLHPDAALEVRRQAFLYPMRRYLNKVEEDPYVLIL